MKYQKVKSTDFFDAANFKSLVQRLENIRPDAERLWGQMNVAQMLHHLNLAIGSGLGYFQLPDSSNFMSRNLVQFMVLNVLKRFPISTKTAPPLQIKEEFDFEKEKALLKEILEKAHRSKKDEDWQKHTFFGKMSSNSWGKLIMIHCNHHFQQFSN